MGLRVYTSIVAGFKVTREEKKIKSIRYNERTGTPYEIEEKVIVFSHEENLNDIEGEGNLSVFYEDNLAEEREEIWGYPIYELSQREDNMIQEINWEECQKIAQKMRSEFPNEKIGIYCVTTFSY